MKLKTVLTLAAIYLGIVGLGVMFAPRQFGIDAVPSDASSELIAFLRILGGPFLGIAAMNWVARNLEPSPALDAVVLGNTVGFAAVTSMDIWGVFSGEARSAAKVFLVIHFLMTVAFVVAGRSMRARRGSSVL